MGGLLFKSAFNTNDSRFLKVCLVGLENSFVNLNFARSIKSVLEGKKTCYWH